MPQNKSLILQTFRPVFRSSFNSKPKTDFLFTSLFTLISSLSSYSLLIPYFSFLTSHSSLLISHFLLLHFSFLTSHFSLSSSSLHSYLLSLHVLLLHFSLLTFHFSLFPHFSFPTPFPLELTPGVPIFRGFKKKAYFILVRV
jgi:hypothetical protein